MSADDPCDRLTQDEVNACLAAVLRSAPRGLTRSEAERQTNLVRAFVWQARIDAALAELIIEGRVNVTVDDRDELVFGTPDEP